MGYRSHIISTIVFLALFSSFCLAAVEKKDPQKLFFLTWADYMDPELISAFESKFDSKVHIVTFSSDAERTELLLSTEGANFDVALLDGISISHYVTQEWLMPLSPDEIPNMKHIFPKWQNAYAGSEEYSVPYFWGTIGVAYRADLLETSISSWMDIFEPKEELHQKIFMLPQNRELLDVALKATGNSINTTNLDAYSRVHQLLLTQRPFVKKYDVPAVTETSALLTGDVLAVLTYNGDAMMLQEINEDVQFVNPIEGGILWGDYLVVLAKSRKKTLAMEFINFLNEPANAAKLAQYVYYATPNSAAEKLLPESFLQDKNIYPEKKILERSELEGKLPPRIIRLRNSIFQDVTNGKI